MILVPSRSHVNMHCSQCFIWQETLKSHLLKSQGEGTWFTCDICDKKFSTKYKIHIHRHDGVKPYVCRGCPKRFHTAGELKRHQPKHSNVKLFICGKCENEFTGA